MFVHIYCSYYVTNMWYYDKEVKQVTSLKRKHTEHYEGKLLQGQLGSYPRCWIVLSGKTSSTPF
jgi:hypothetical protein